MEKDKLVADLTKKLATKDQELVRIRKDLSERSALLEQTQGALCQALKSQAMEPDIRHSQMGDELAQQQKETANLREKMERFERLFSQVRDLRFRDCHISELGHLKMNMESKRPNNMA